MKKLIPFVLLVVASALAVPSLAADVVHKVAVHVDSNDPKVINLALNNVANVKKYYDSVGEEVEIEVVAYGPGLHMFRADTSPVIERISVMALEIDNLTFSACGNTHAKMSEKAGKDIQLLEEASMVPSGVVQLIALQEQGYSYIRP
ncbi:MAG: DsrE family protein [Granulosicoccus sp.]|nr:DsrE family protein [Granulosicoccus sp.]